MLQDKVTYRILDDVIGVPGYAAGDDGSIWSRVSGRWKRLKCWHTTKSGHLYFTAGGAGGKQLAVHRVILECFVSKQPPGMIGLHWNDDPNDNRVSNLRWGTHQDNADDAKRNGGRAMGERSGPSKLHRRQVLDIRERYANGESKESLAKRYSVTRMCIHKIVNRQTWRHV